MASDTDVMCVVMAAVGAVFIGMNMGEYFFPVDEPVRPCLPNVASSTGVFGTVAQFENGSPAHQFAIWTDSISDGDAAVLRAWVDAALDKGAAVSHGNAYWNDKIAYVTTASPPHIQTIVFFVVHAASRYMRTMYGHDDIYPNTVSVARMGVGGGVPVDADNAYYPDCTGPHYSHMRTFSSVTYLSTHARDFTGGVFQFKTGNITITPTCGTTLLFGAGCDYYHRATPVQSGTRYSIAAWFTDKESNTLWALASK